MQVCSRCCLRYAGVRSGIYTTPAPITAHLCQALEQLAGKLEPIKPPGSDVTDATTATAGEQGATAQNGAVSTDEAPSTAEDPPTTTRSSPSDPSVTERAGEPLRAGTSGVDPPEESMGGGGQGQAGGVEQGGGREEAVCRVCLGVLQSLDGRLGAVSAELQTELSDRDGGGAPWSPVARGDVNSIADHIRCTIPLLWYS